MKELSIEEKAKRYDDALAMAKECITYIPDEAVNKYMLNMFPELAESESEKIRKTIVRFFKDNYPNETEMYDGSVTVGKIIDWLEKQGIHHLICNKEDDEIKKEIINYFKCQSREEPSRRDIHNKWIAWLEKQGEQKSIDKVEPQFHEGDWVIGANNVFKIISLNDELNCYTVVTPNNEEAKIPYYFDDGQGHMCSYHLWTIQDAKDGDVLYSPFHNLIWIYKDSEHYHVCVNLNYTTQNIAINGLIGIPKDVFPATKDEQTILFERIKEDGCEWNAEKKELNKVIIYESKVRE